MQKSTVFFFTYRINYKVKVYSGGSGGRRRRRSGLPGYKI